MLQICICYTTLSVDWTGPTGDWLTSEYQPVPHPPPPPPPHVRSSIAAPRSHRHQPWQFYWVPSAYLVGFQVTDPLPWHRNMKYDSGGWGEITLGVRQKPGLKDTPQVADNTDMGIAWTRACCPTWADKRDQLSGRGRWASDCAHPGDMSADVACSSVGPWFMSVVYPVIVCPDRHQSVTPPTQIADVFRGAQRRPPPGSPQRLRHDSPG